MFLSSIEVLRGAGSRVVPLVAHDRTGFGGALITNGVTIMAMAVFAVGMVCSYRYLTELQPSRT